jgi:FMN reductase
MGADLKPEMTGPPIRVLGLGGSLAEPSRSLEVLRIALEGAEEAGARAELLSVRQLDLPFYRPDHPAPPESVRRLCDAAGAADGMLWSSPLYHGTVSGAFKNAIDWLQLLAGGTPPYLTDRVVGLISVAGGTQGLQAVNTMEFVVRALRGWSVPLVIPVPLAHQSFDADGRLLDQGVAGQLRALGGEVTRAARRFRTGAPLTDRSAQAAEAALQPLDDG